MTNATKYPGSRWWKFDFHTHTPASQDTYWATQPEVSLSPEDWLFKWMAAEVDCVAITDHNSGAWIDKLKDTYSSMEAAPPEGFRELVLFPGVELSVSGGIHVLAIFDPSRSSSDIDTLLGAAGYRGAKGDSKDDVTEKSILDVIREIVRAGAIPIPAHVDGPKGLLELKGEGVASARVGANTLRQICEPGLVFAAEVIEPASPKPTVFDEARCQWTEVLGSDCHSFQGQCAPGVRFTWIKMSEPTVEGLRFALQDGPRFSVRRSDDALEFDPDRLPEHFIESISIDDAKYMGRGAPEELRFSPWFNGIVGGRGTGKSSVVHALRLSFRRDGELLEDNPDSDAARVFNAFKQAAKGRTEGGGLRETTELLATVSRDGVRHRVRWRNDGQGELVEEEDPAAGWVPSSSQDVSAQRFPVRIYSQGQIASMADSRHGALLLLVDELAGTDAQLRSLSEEQEKFLTLRTRARGLQSKLHDRSATDVELTDVERKLAGFEGEQNSSILKRFRLHAQQQQELEQRANDAERLQPEIERLANDVDYQELPAEVFPADEDSSTAAHAYSDSIRDALSQAELELRATGRKLATAIASAKSDLRSSPWSAEVELTRAAYGELTAKLESEGVTDLGEYAQLVEKRQELRTKMDGFESLQVEVTELAEELLAQRVTVRASRRELQDERERFLARVLADNKYVRISLVRYGHAHRSIEQSLRAALSIGEVNFERDILVETEGAPDSGLIHDLLDGLPEDNTRRAEAEARIDTWRRRFEAAAAGRGDFSGRLNSNLERSAKARPEFLDRLLIYSPDDDLRVEYSPRGDGKSFRSIGQASAGQQAAAMLAFLLAEGTEPIVLDQPEDDLDNHLIYELVVSQIRENKLRRQLIVVTHNANIVVNGDAEMVHALQFAGGQCRVGHRGSLQEGEVRAEVCKIMEGGAEAFERRYARLGSDSATNSPSSSPPKPSKEPN